ncbi:MAG: hypothetical protein ACPGCY_08760, partial [Henriciella sp.]
IGYDDRRGSSSVGWCPANLVLVSETGWAQNRARLSRLQLSVRETALFSSQMADIGAPVASGQISGDEGE